jgi:hypothetical protein
VEQADWVDSACRIAIIVSAVGVPNRELLHEDLKKSAGFV